MPRFAVAFVAPSENGQLLHHVIESADKESALKSFFTEFASEYYSNDEQGYHYFKEDFFDEVAAGGSIIEL
jgi:hypothetical protein